MQPPSLLRFVVAALSATGAVSCALAQDLSAPQATSVVVVRSVRDPVDRSYRKMIKGMDRFEREHALAPQAGLRFRLLPRVPNARMDGITLRVAGERVDLPIAVAPDNSFVLERNEQ